MRMFFIKFMLNLMYLIKNEQANSTQIIVSEQSHFISIDFEWSTIFPIFEP